MAETEAEYQADYVSTNYTPYLVSYEVSFVNICGEIDRVITTPHCICQPIVVVYVCMN